MYGLVYRTALAHIERLYCTLRYIRFIAARTGRFSTPIPKSMEPCQSSPGCLTRALHEALHARQKAGACVSQCGNKFTVAMLVVASSSGARRCEIQEQEINRDRLDKESREDRSRRQCLFSFNVHAPRVRNVSHLRSMTTISP